MIAIFQVIFMLLMFEAVAYVPEVPDPPAESSEEKG